MEAPPAYGDVVGNMRQNTLVKGCFDLLGNVIAIIIIIAFMFALNVVSILMGAGIFGECDEDKIMTWLIVSGSVGIPTSILGFIINKYYKKEEGEEVNCGFDTTEGRLRYANGVLVLFTLIWLIIGSVWVYKYDAGPNYAHCDRDVYLYAFWLITVSWILMGVVILLCCCLCCVACCVAAAS